MSLFMSNASSSSRYGQTWTSWRLLTSSHYSSTVVASVTQQSMQRVPQSLTEYRLKRPKVTWVQTDNTARQRPAAERRWCLCIISETGTQSAARYCGAVPMRQRRVKMMTLHLTRSGTSSQWRLMHQLHQTVVDDFLVGYLSERGLRVEQVVLSSKARAKS